MEGASTPVFHFIYSKKTAATFRDSLHLASSQKEYFLFLSGVSFVLQHLTCALNGECHLLYLWCSLKRSCRVGCFRFMRAVPGDSLPRGLLLQAGNTGHIEHDPEEEQRLIAKLVQLLLEGFLQLHPALGRGLGLSLEPQSKVMGLWARERRRGQGRLKEDNAEGEKMANKYWDRRQTWQQTCISPSHLIKPLMSTVKLTY